MNTPAHIVLNTLVLARGDARRHWRAVALGAFVPDLPMMGFYAYQRLVLGHAEATIWGTAYFDASWQVCFDVFHSLPIIAAGALLAWLTRSPMWVAFFASMALHCVFDLPLHHDDGHAHFFPLSAWRFRSPVSYWDPNHHGSIVLVAEALMITLGCASLARPHQPRGLRIAAAALLVATLALGAYATLVWGGAADLG
ncbi:MAG: hypothetical protein ACE5FL_01070 [Myxococcota bacterium]